MVLEVANHNIGLNQKLDCRGCDRMIYNYLYNKCLSPLKL